MEKVLNNIKRRRKEIIKGLILGLHHSYSYLYVIIQSNEPIFTHAKAKLLFYTRQSQSIVLDINSFTAHNAFT